MNLILFIHQDASENGEILKGVIKQNFNRFDLQTIQTFNALKARLKLISSYDNEVFVLLTDSETRLNELCSLADLLEDRRIVLILFNDSKATLSKAQRLFPRYFTYMNDTYKDLCSVLAKMMNKEPINKKLMP